MKEALELNIPEELKDAFKLWLDNMNDAAKTKEAALKIVPILESYKEKMAELRSY